jgi:hypothetical protein
MAGSALRAAFELGTRLQAIGAERRFPWPTALVAGKRHGYDLRNDVPLSL